VLFFSAFRRSTLFLIQSHSAARGSGLPKVPLEEFARLKESRPAKRPKAADTELHTVDVKSVKFVLNIFGSQDAERTPESYRMYAKSLIPNSKIP
jgi:hypothetical protein